MKKILVIEDEPNIRELVLYNLKTNGYDGIEAEDGIMGITMVHREKPDLILLDIMLPGKNGYEICKELRDEGNNTPIIIITAKTDEMDKVMGLEYGADDYISKPFGIREMMARINAVLRRYEFTSEGTVIEGQAADETVSHGTSLDATTVHGTPADDTVIAVKNLNINIDRHEVKVNGKEIELTYKEFELLKYLMENRGHVFTRDQLLNKVWGIDYVGETRTVDVHVRHLRQKLSQDDDGEQYIETVRGKGYKAK